MSIRGILAVLMCAAMAAALAAGDSDWDEAERRILRIAPAQLRDIPKRIVAELQQRGCTIPQPYGMTRQSNIVKGEFAKPGQTDWAALCSRAGVSTLLVFWGAGNPCPAEVHSSKDRNWLTDTGAGIGYLHQIVPVGRAYIEEHYQAYGGPIPPPIDHQGIDRSFLEKASVVHYCHQGRWLELTGAD